MADQRKYIQAQKFKLAGSGISATDTSITLQSFMTPNSETIAMTDIGTLGFGSLGPGTSREEIISFTGVTQNADGTATLTGVTRGLDFRSPYTADTALRKSHSGNETFILTNNPQFYDSFANKENDETINGAYIFTQVPVTTGGDAVTAGGLVRLAQLQAAVLGSLTNLAIVSPGTAGETIAAGNLIYFKAADARWWKCDADTAATVDNILMAIAQGAGTAGNAITDGVLLFGMDTNQTSLSAGSTYYAGNTAGAIVSTPGTVEVTIGQANTTTDLYFSPRYNQQLTEDQQDALVGTSGTPSATNKFVTADDVSNAGASDKIVRLNGTAYPAGDGSAITGVDFKTESYTASGAISQNDSVYVTSANTVKTLYPSAQGTGSAVSTAPSHVASGMMAIPLSTNGLYLSFCGGVDDISGILYAQVRTINAGETDFANGSEVNVYATGNGTRSYDVCQIGTDKFMVIFQADTGGAAAGIKVCVLTVSGTTITVGAVTTIETTGGLTRRPTCAKSDTDKGVIYYQKDSDSDLYAQVLTVSGTTITTNTPVLVKAFSGTGILSATQLGTDSNALIYQDGSNNIFGRTITISGTTPTINSENTIVSIANSSEGFGVTFISSTKLFFAYSNNSPVNDTCLNIAISGSTMTPSSTLVIGSSRSTRRYGTRAIGTKYLLFMNYQGSNQEVLNFLDVSGTTPTSTSTQTLTCTTPSNYTSSIVKVSPWTYMVTGNVGDSDYIVKLTPVSSGRIGMAQSGISDAASGTIMLRYKTQTLSGITLTPGSLYYVDDTGQPTVNSSSTSPTLGIAISTTKILLQ